MERRGRMRFPNNAPKIGQTVYLLDRESGRIAEEKVEFLGKSEFLVSTWKSSTWPIHRYGERDRAWFDSLKNAKKESEKIILENRGVRVIDFDRTYIWWDPITQEDIK